MKRITEKDNEQEKWYEEAKEQTLETLPAFLKHLSEDYGHNYGTICHAVTAAAIAAASAMNHGPSGGITGFQAGAVMWEFIGHWTHEGNKTGMRLIDYDNMLYPQYYDKFQKTISQGTWDALQKEAARLMDEADAGYEQWKINKAAYEKDIAAFIVKYPDYYERKEHYDHLGMGTGDQWAIEDGKKKSGFEFAPTEPYEPINSRSPVYRHWASILKGAIPFGYTISPE